MVLALVLLLALTDAADSPPSLAMFCLVAFVLTVVGQELWRGTAARRTMTGESWPRALARLTGRNRRRYGGYLVHAGIAVLFLGVAASSAFVEQRDVRLSPGDSFEVNGYQVTYREATAKLGGDSSGTGAPISFGAVLDVRKDGKHFVMRPSRNYYSSGDPSLGTISRFFEGEATSEVDVRWGLTARPLAGGAARHRLARGADPRGRRQVRRLARRRAGADRRGARRALPQRPAAGRVPRDRVAARGVDLDRRRDRGAGRAGRGLALARRRGCAACARSTRPGSAESSRARRRPWSTPSPWSCSRCSWPPCCPCRCGGRGEEERREETRLAELRPRRRRSTARSATPSWTTGWASSPASDWRAVDRDLRGEAIEILRELDRLEGRMPEGGMDR